MRSEISCRPLAITTIALILAFFSLSPLTPFTSIALAKKGGNGNGGGNGGGGSGGGDPTVFFSVELVGALYWEDLDGSAPSSRIARLEGNGGNEILLINRINPEPCAAQARTNVNVMSNDPNLDNDLDQCFPRNTDNDGDGQFDDRVYGGTMAVQDASIDLINNGTAEDVKLSIPNGFNKNGRSSSYILWLSVVAADQELSDGLAAALRALDLNDTDLSNDSLTLTLGGWILTSGKGKPSLCSGSGGLVGTTLVFTPHNGLCPAIP